MKRCSLWLVILVLGFIFSVPISVSLAAEGKEITVIGVVERSKRMDFLATDNEKYRVIGQDFSKLIGKTLKVTGKESDGPSGKTLLVTFMEIVGN